MLINTGRSRVVKGGNRGEGKAIIEYKRRGDISGKISSEYIS